MDTYVYYKVRAELAGALQAQVLDMQAALEEKCGIATALRRRATEKDGRHTWMEIYLAVPDKFDEMLEQAVTRSRLAALIDSDRHIEYFVDPSSCV